MPRKPENPDHKRQPLPDIEVHPWRLCPYGEHSRETHPLHVKPSKKNPSGITTRHYTCVKNPDYKDALYPHEIEQIAETHFASLTGLPKAYNFKRPNGNSYDSFIRGWTVKSTARGLMQLVPTSVKALKNYKGELRDHFVILTRNDLFDPNLNICGGIRWFFHKKKLREIRLKRPVSWIEAVAEYKGVDMENDEVKNFEKRLTEIKAAK